MGNVRIEDAKNIRLMAGQSWPMPESEKKIMLSGKKKGIVVTNLSDDQGKVKPGAIPAELFMEWKELDRTGKLGKIKQDNWTLYCVLYFERFGKYPKQEKGKNCDVKTKGLYEGYLKAKKIEMYSKMTFDELSKADKLQDYKTIDPAGYAGKFFQKFNRLPKSSISKK